MTVTSLSRRGAEQLARAEEAIERGLTTFVEVGQALVLIRDGRLYREQHESFEAYCRSRWKFSSRRANQLMDAAEIGTMVPISNERQARELAPLKDDPEAVQAAYDEAAASGDVTSASLATAVEAKRPKAPPKIEPGEVDGVESPPASPDSLTPKLRLAALFARQAEVREWIAFDGHEAVISSMSSSQRADYGRFLIAVSNHVGTSHGYIDKLRLKVAK